jgi:hypothetical protein
MKNKESKSPNKNKTNESNNLSTEKSEPKQINFLSFIKSLAEIKDEDSSNILFTQENNSNKNEENKSISKIDKEKDKIITLLYVKNFTGIRICRANVYRRKWDVFTRPKSAQKMARHQYDLAIIYQYR